MPTFFAHAVVIIHYNVSMIIYTYNMHTSPQLYTAAHMWCLGRLLPVMIGDMIPADDEHWQNFLDMMTIVDYVFAPAVTPTIAAFLHGNIRDHHDCFCRLYPDSSLTDHNTLSVYTTSKNLNLVIMKYHVNN